jgi:DNA-binding response OmpR family regulator
MRALLIEDDEGVCQFLIKGFKEEGWEVEVAKDGKTGLHLATDGTFHVIVLDLLLPGMNGIEVLKRIREEGIKTPVVILTALDEKTQIVQGLDSGADDYLVKPFYFTELMARIRAILRRGEPVGRSVLQVADLRLDPVRRKVERGGRPIDLTPKEFSLLEYFMRNPGRVLTRVMILEHVFDYHFDSMTNLVDVHVYRLRNKVDRGFSRQLIRTVKGVGYVLEE